MSSNLNVLSTWGGLLTLSQTEPWFLHVCGASLLKTLFEKDKFLTISPFPTEFSARLENFLPFPSNLKLLSANSVSLEESIICCLGKG